MRLLQLECSHLLGSEVVMVILASLTLFSVCGVSRHQYARLLEDRVLIVERQRLGVGGESEWTREVEDGQQECRPTWKA